MGNDRRSGDDRVCMNCVNWPRLPTMAVWMRGTFKNHSGNLAKAYAEGKRPMDAVGRDAGCFCGVIVREEALPSEEIANRMRRDVFVMQIKLHESIRIADFHGDELEERGRPKMALPFAPTMIFMPEAIGDGPPDCAGSGGGNVWQTQERHDDRHADLDWGKALNRPVRGRLPALSCAARAGVSRIFFDARTGAGVGKR